MSEDNEEDIDEAEDETGDELVLYDTLTRKKQPVSASEDLAEEDEGEDAEEDEEAVKNHCKADESHKWAGWAEAFTIFAKYADKEDGVDNVSAEHDEIFAGPDPKIVSAEDKARLNALGWGVERRYECFRKFT